MERRVRSIVIKLKWSGVSAPMRLNWSTISGSKEAGKGRERQNLDGVLAPSGRYSWQQSLPQSLRIRCRPMLQ